MPQYFSALQEAATIHKRLDAAHIEEKTEVGTASKGPLPPPPGWKTLRNPPVDPDCTSTNPGFLTAAAPQEPSCSANSKGGVLVVEV